MRSAAATGIVLALVAGVLFGLVNVAAKSTDLHPVAKGGLAYLLAGVVLAPALRGLRILPTDRILVAAMVVVGGSLAPTLLFVGLEQAGASAASFLLTLEMVFTAMFAHVFLRERTSMRARLGLALLFGSALLVAATVGDDRTTSVAGAALVTAAGLAWGVDNTLSARLVGTYTPRRLVAVKGLLGGGLAILASVVLGWRGGIGVVDVAPVLFIGVLGIAVSITMFYGSLLRIGATRTTGLFVPVTTLAGAAAGWLYLDEPFHWLYVVAAVALLAGVWLMTREGAKRAGPA